MTEDPSEIPLLGDPRAQPDTSILIPSTESTIGAIAIGSASTTAQETMSELLGTQPTTESASDWCGSGEERLAWPDSGVELRVTSDGRVGGYEVRRTTGAPSIDILMSGLGWTATPDELELKLGDPGIDPLLAIYQFPPVDERAMQIQVGENQVTFVGFTAQGCAEFQM